MEGKLRVNNQIQVQRGEEILGKGRITSLKRDKEDVKEVSEGVECGMVIEGAPKIELADILLVFLIK